MRGAKRERERGCRLGHRWMARRGKASDVNVEGDDGEVYNSEKVVAVV